MGRIFDEVTQKWIDTNSAVDIPLNDRTNSYPGANNVEEALQQVAQNMVKNETTMMGYDNTLKEHQEQIDWILVNGGGGSGGGGGAVAPTLTSNIVENSFVVDKGADVILPLFFKAPNLGDGVLIVMLDGVERDTYTIKQGNNNINIGVLPNLSNKISVYAKDRMGLISNQIEWEIICGGIDLTLDFDYNIDYTFGSDIFMPFNIYSPTVSPVVLNMKIDNDNYTINCDQGYNEYTFTNLTVGVHTITLQASDGKYNSQSITFNLVIVDSSSLYLSSTFVSGTSIDFGLPVVIDYRISNATDETMTVNLTLDGELYKTLKAKRGAYSWTLNGLAIQGHSYKIEVISATETRSITGTFSVVQGEYTPILTNNQGLVYRLFAGDRTNQDVDKEKPVYNDISATLHDFTFSSNGWVDGVLVCNGGAYVEIDYSPWKDNAPSSSTIEIDFKAVNTGDLEARVLEYKDTNTNKGIFIGLEEAKINSISNEGKVFVNADEWTTMSFVIDRKTKFAKVFINGVCTRAFRLRDSGSGVDTILEDFAFNGKMYLGCANDLSKKGSCEIKDLRIYRRALSDDEIVKNVIAQESNLIRQKELFDFNFNNNTLPVMRMYGDTNNMTLETPVTLRIKYTSPNTEKYGQPFDLQYCKVYWQGTSSLDYVLKNYNIELRDNNLSEKLYSPFPNGVEESIFCLKADYMESSHSRNVGIARFVEECLYDTKNPAQVTNPNVRNSVEGFPMLLYINDELQGVYNFNTDRRSTRTFGYTDVDKHLVYEISANSDTTAGAFYKWNSASGKTEIDYYKSDFMCIYPPTRVAGNDSFTEIKRLVEWVDNASDEDFKDNIGLYFNKKYLIRYYLFAMVFGAVDSLGKNMKLATWDGKIWYPQIYDCDTTLGLDNTGFLKFDSDIEIGDEGVFNTTSSKLWSKVKLLFDAEIKSEYSLMRQSKFTLTNLYKYIIEEQMNKIPSKYYNQDMQTKYLNFGSSYLYALHGRGEQQIKTWLTDRLLYVDTLLKYTVSTSDYVTIRSSKLGEVFLNLQTYNSMYLSVKWRNEVGDASLQTLRCKKGETVKFSFNMPTATDQEIRIYGGKYIKSLGDVSNLAPTTLLLAKAPGLRELICHSANLINTDLSECINLHRVDLSNCTSLGSGVGAQVTVNVSKCTNIEYVNCQNTQITGILLNDKGSNIRELWYPITIQAITLANCPNLTTVGLQNGHSCNSLKLINCPKVENFGDRQWSSVTQTYKYENSYFLRGLQSVYLDNAYLTKSLCFCSNIGLTNVTVKNLPTLEDIRLAHNKNSNTTDISTLQNAGNFKLESYNCPKLKTFATVDLGHEYFNARHGINDIGGGNQRDQYYLNYEMDLSNSSIENVYFYMKTHIGNLKLPTTVKNIEIDDLLGRTNRKDDGYYNYREITDVNYDSIANGNSNMYIGIFGSVVFNIFCPSVKGDSYTDTTVTLGTPGVWDFEGLVITDLLCTKMNLGNSNAEFYSNFSIKLRNASINPVKYTPCFRLFKSGFENVSLNMSKYVGESLSFALAYITDNVEVILAPNYDKVYYVDRCLQYTNTSKIKWTDSVVTKWLANLSNQYELQGTVLQEQLDYGTDGVIISIDKSSLWTNNSGDRLGTGSNLKYIKELNLPNATSTSYLLGCSTKNDFNANPVPILRIGKINAPKCNSAIFMFAHNTCIDRVDQMIVGEDCDFSNVFVGSSIKYLSIEGSTIGLGNAFGGSSLTHLDLSKLTIKGNMAHAFTGLSLNRLELHGVSSTSEHSLRGSSVVELDLSDLTINGSTHYMFSGATIGSPLVLNGSSSNHNFMFQGSKLNSLDVSSFTLAGDGEAIFKDCVISGGMDFSMLKGSSTNSIQAFMNINSPTLDLTLLSYELGGSCKGTFENVTVSSITVKGNSTNSERMFYGVNCGLLNLTELSINGSSANILQNSTVQNLMGLNISGVTILNSAFKNATINGGSLPNVSQAVQCTSIGYMYNGYNGSLPIPSPFIVPPLCKSLSNIFNNANTVTHEGRTFVLDCSKMEKLVGAEINTTFDNITNLDLKLIVPPVVVDNTGAEIDNNFQYLINSSSLNSFEIDWTHFTGTKAGFRYVFAHSVTNGANANSVVLKGIDYDKFGTSALSYTSNLFISEFTVNSPAYNTSINHTQLRMSFDNHKKFINEALGDLDCANLLGTMTVDGTNVVSRWFKVDKITRILNLGGESKYGIKVLIALEDGTDSGGSQLKDREWWKTNPNYSFSTYYNATWEGRKGVKYRIEFMNASSDLASIQSKINSDTYSYRLGNPSQTPKTLTVSKIMSKDSGLVMSVDQQAELISMAIPKGWNMVFV